MPAKGNNISPQDFVNLKALVKKEMQRRTNAKSSGSMAAYCNSNYDYSEIPNSSKLIKDEHVQKITQPIDATTGSKTTPSSKATIYADVLDKAAVIIANLSKKGITSKDTGCAGACSGLCSGNCYSTCTGCTGSCSGTCTGCGAACSNNCTGCTGGCNGCTGCSGTCSGSCTGSCSTTCTGSCAGSCKGTCEASAPVVAILAKQIARIPVIVVVLAIALITVRELAVFNVATRQPVMERVQVFVLLLPFKGGILNVCK